MKIVCPRCERTVPAAHANVATDLAVCPECDEAFRISSVLGGTEGDPQVLDNPPSGTWFEEEIRGFRVGATTRSPIAFFLVPFMLVWTGGSVGIIYGSQIVGGQFNLPMSLFGIPFLLGAVIFWSFALMAIWGRVEVIVDDRDGRVFTGVAGIGRVRRFDAASVKDVRENAVLMRYPGSSQGALVIEGRERVQFATGVSQRRRYFLLHALRRGFAGVR